MANKKKPAGRKRPAADAAIRSADRPGGPADKIRLPAREERGPSSGAADRAGADPASEHPEQRYYRLHTRAVEDLVSANEENAPPVSKAELKKYHAAPKKTWPDGVKAILLKAWFAGIVCYFFVWGLSSVSLHQMDLMLILGIALGLISNLITANLFRMMAKTPGAPGRWLMVSRKEIWFLPLDLLYGLLLVSCVMATYNGINTTAARLTGNTESAFLGVEPILFGLFTLAWDLLFLGMKQLLRRIVRDARHNVKPG